jgi:hypothetical protein
MEILTQLSVLLAVVIVAVAAWHLIVIAVNLKRTGDSLQALAAGLVAVRDHTAPLKGHVNQLNGGLGTLHQRLEAVRAGLAAVAAHLGAPKF